MEDSPGLWNSTSIRWHLSQPVPRLSLLCMDDRFLRDRNWCMTRLRAYHICYSSPSSTSAAAVPSTHWHTLDRWQPPPWRSRLCRWYCHFWPGPKLPYVISLWPYKIKRPAPDFESVDRRPKSATSVTQTQESRLPSVDSRWRKWQISFILAVSSPRMGMQKLLFGLLDVKESANLLAYSAQLYCENMMNSVNWFACDKMR